MERLKLNIQRFAGPAEITFPNNGSMSGKIAWSSAVIGNTPAEKAANNKSSVYAAIYVRRNDGYTTTGNFTGNLNINGTNKTFNINFTAGNDWHGIINNVIEVPHNADGSKSITISGSITGPSETTWAGKTVSGSGTCVLDKIPRYATSVQSLKSKTETSITMNWSSDNTCDYIWYSTNNGGSWTAVGGVNAKSGSYTISGLSANTTYNIKTRVRRKDSQLTTDSSALSIATYPYPYCSSAPNFTIGDNSVTISLYNPLNRNVELQMYSYVGSVFINSTRLTTNVNGNYSFPVGNYVSQLYASIPNAKTSKYNIDVWYGSHKEIKSGGNYSVNESINTPTFSDFDYEDIDSTTLALTGDSSILVQNYSDVKATITTTNKATAKNSATMVRYNLVIGNQTSSVNYSDSSSVNTTINNATSSIINLYAEDSRGLTTLVSKTATLKAYTNIQKGNINIVRAGNVGTGVTLSFDGTYWNENFGSVTNSIKSVNYRFKKTTDSTWTTGTTSITPTTNNNTYSFSGGIAGDLGNTGFSVEYSFNVEITVTDELSTTTFSFVLGTGIPIMAFADGGVSINNPYDETKDDGLQVSGKIYLNGREISGGGGVDIPQQDNPPSNPSEDDLWIDTDEPGVTNIDSTVSTTSTNPIENKAITNYVNDISPTCETISYTSNYMNKRIYKFNGFQVITINLYAGSVQTDADGQYTFTPGNWGSPFSSQPTVVYSVVKDTSGNWTHYALDSYGISTTSAGSYRVSRKATGTVSGFNAFINIIAIGPTNN